MKKESPSCRICVLHKGRKVPRYHLCLSLCHCCFMNNSCLLNADQTGILTLCWSGSQVSFRNTPHSRHDSGFRLWSYLPCVPSETIFQPWIVLSDRSLRRTPLLPSLFAYREYFKAKSAKLQGVSGKFMILFIFAADNTLLFIAGNTINAKLILKNCTKSVDN